MRSHPCLPALFLALTSVATHATDARAATPRETTATTTERLGTQPPGLGLAVGTAAPDATLRDGEARPVRLAELISRGPILLVFYRGGWCPYCNFQIRELTLAYPELQRRGVTPVAISVDRPEEAGATRAAYAIPFPILSDPDLGAHRTFQVIHHADDAEVARLKGFGIDLEAASGRRHHDIAVPSLFLIDATGAIRWGHVDPEYKVRPTTAQILTIIDRIGPLNKKVAP